MILFVVSDTHGKIDAALRAYRSIEHVDQILHLGDTLVDAQRMEEDQGVPILSVGGNADGVYAQDAYRILETEFGPIYLSHGHVEAVKGGPENLLYKATSLGCKAAFYGHTHVPVARNLGDIYLLNPGSISRPYGRRPGSYAVVEITPVSLSARIEYVDGHGGSKSGLSGSLRQMLNDADRF